MKQLGDIVWILDFVLLKQDTWKLYSDLSTAAPTPPVGVYVYALKYVCRVDWATCSCFAGIYQRGMQNAGLEEEIDAKEQTDKQLSTTHE